MDNGEPRTTGGTATLDGVRPQDPPVRTDVLDQANQVAENAMQQPQSPEAMLTVNPDVTNPETSADSDPVQSALGKIREIENKRTGDDKVDRHLVRTPREKFFQSFLKEHSDLHDPVVIGLAGEHQQFRHFLLKELMKEANMNAAPGSTKADEAMRETFVYEDLLKEIKRLKDGKPDMPLLDVKLSSQELRSIRDKRYRLRKKMKQEDPETARLWHSITDPREPLVRKDAAPAVQQVDTDSATAASDHEEQAIDTFDDETKKSIAATDAFLENLGQEIDQGIEKREAREREEKMAAKKEEFQDAVAGRGDLGGAPVASVLSEDHDSPVPITVPEEEPKGYDMQEHIDIAAKAMEEKLKLHPRLARAIEESGISDTTKESLTNKAEEELFRIPEKEKDSLFGSRIRKIGLGTTVLVAVTALGIAKQPVAEKQEDPTESDVTPIVETVNPNELGADPSDKVTQVVSAAVGDAAISEESNTTVDGQQVVTEEEAAGAQTDNSQVNTTETTAGPPQAQGEETAAQAEQNQSADTPVSDEELDKLNVLSSTLQGVVSDSKAAESITSAEDTTSSSEAETEKLTLVESQGGTVTPLSAGAGETTSLSPEVADTQAEQTPSVKEEVTVVANDTFGGIMFDHYLTPEQQQQYLIEANGDRTEAIGKFLSDPKNTDVIAQTLTANIDMINPARLQAGQGELTADMINQTVEQVRNGTPAVALMPLANWVGTTEETGKTFTITKQQAETTEGDQVAGSKESQEQHSAEEAVHSFGTGTGAETAGAGVTTETADQQEVNPGGDQAENSGDTTEPQKKKGGFFGWLRRGK